MLPFWLKQYQRAWLAGDLTAGVVVALMLVPQGMAYALVAGLPPVVGLYAGILPSFAYALFGTSMTQSVGPMAVTSLMIATALTPLAAPDSLMYLQLSAQLALLCGLTLLLCGVFRLGFLANFLSRPVMSGFTTGAAALIIGGQIPLLYQGTTASPLSGQTLTLGLAALLLLWLAQRYLGRGLRRLRLPHLFCDILPKLMPVIVILCSTWMTQAFQLTEIRLIGAVPAGLPAWTMDFSLSAMRPLISPALMLAFVIFMSSQSAAQALALKRRQRLITDRELLGLGAANLAAAVSGSMAVTGSISRSAVNFAAGANSPLATLISALLLVLLLLAPPVWLGELPLCVLSATIILAVAGMLDFATLATAWRYDKSDAAALLATAGGVLALGVDAGVLIGVGISLATLLYRTSNPHLAVIGRIAGSEHFRNVRRHQVETLPGVLFVRVDAAFFFGNIETVLDAIRQHLQNEEARELVLVLSAANLIDTSALLSLGEFILTLSGQGVRTHLAEVRGPVMDRLKRTDFLGSLSGQVFLSSSEAFIALQNKASRT